MVLFIYGQVNSFVLVALKPPPKKQIDHLVETFDLDDSGASCVLRLASCVLRLAPCAVRRAPCAVRRAPCAAISFSLSRVRSSNCVQPQPFSPSRAWNHTPDNLDLLEFKVLTHRLLVRR